MTAFATTDTAIEAMKRGAFDYLFKPRDRVQLRTLVERAVEIRRRMQTPVELPGESEIADAESDQLVGRCSAMQEVYKAIGRAAPHATASTAAACE